MSKPNRSVLYALATILVVTALCLPVLVAQKQKTAPPTKQSGSSSEKPTPAELPAGPMQETARNACTICHDAGIIIQQRLSKDAWGKEVDKMVRWGTVLDPKDRDPLIDYLSSNFPPDKQAGVVSRVSAKK